MDGGLGLGNPLKLPIGSPGGFASYEAYARAKGGAMSNAPSVTNPAEVRFDHGLEKKEDRFCFAVTAAGWHTGALVVDLKPEV